MGINCPSCGGKMFFNITKQALQCSYCDTLKTIDEYKANNESEVQQMTYDTVVYTCRNCGRVFTFPSTLEHYPNYCLNCRKNRKQEMKAKYGQPVKRAKGDAGKA